MPTMATIRHHARIDASPDDVWAIVSDAGGIADWAPGMEPGSVVWDGTTFHPRAGRGQFLRRGRPTLLPSAPQRGTP